MTAIDGASTTFTYANGSGTLVSEIASAGSRSWTLTHTSTNLTEIEDPDERTRVFGYDGDHHLTDETRGILVNHWDYDAESELIVQMRWGNESSPSTTDIDSVASRGLEDLYIGLPDAETTDALGYVTNYRLDAKGRQLKVTDANGAISTWTRNAGTGRVESYIDPIGRQTSYTRDADGYVTVQTNPDLTTRTWDFFANAFHSLQYFTDENTHETEYEVDSATGHVVTIIDALNKETVNAYDPETGLLETITDPMTRVVTLGYDGYRRLETREDVLGITTYGFDTTTGEVNSVEDANELETTMEFDDMGRMLSRTTPDLFQEFWVHNTAGLLETHTNKEEVDDKIVYDYFARGLVYATIDAFGTDLERSRITSFDDVGRNIGWRDALGYWSSITLDSVGRTVATFDAMGNETLSRYDLASQVIQSRDANGIWVYNTYNDRGWIEESIDSRGELWVTGFDDVGNVTSRTDPNSKETVTAYDALNRVVSVTDPELNISQTSYWDDGRVKDQTDARGKITRTEYNLEAKEIYITHALGTGKERTYTQTIDAVGNVLTTEDPNTHVQTNILDEMYRVRKVEDNAGRGDEYSFTAEGVVSQIEDESNELTLFTIDKLGRTIKTEDASGIETERFYNAADAVTAVLDDEDNYARSVFDKNGRLIASIDGRGYATHYVYNAGGLMIAYIDALSNTTRWEYDKAGNKTKEIDPLGNFRTWEYDDAGQLEKYTDKRGWTKEYTYFDNGLVETETWKDDLAATVNEVEYTYNENGQIDTVTDDAGTYDWDYDDLGRVEMVTDIWGIETTFDYDLADRLEVVADSLGGEMTYGYDSADRVETKDFDDGTTQLGMVFHYNNRNELEELERFDDNPTLIGKTLFTYFDNGQVESITHKDGSNVLINDFNYTYGDAGNVATETSDLGPSKTYGYDEDDQILTDGTNTYEWDALGNDTGHTIDPGNQLQTDGTWNYTYDEEGNTTEKVNIGNDEIWSYGYDSSNRLVLAEHKPNSVSDVDIRIVFGYDVLNNRILESVDADGDGVDPEVITKFAYDTNGNAFADLEDNLDLRTRRIYNDAVDALAARIDADTGDPNWYLTDMLGSVRDMVDKAGDPLNHRDWDAFGVQIADSGTGFDRYGYTSREYQAEMELQYNRARWYDPTTQRWLSMDPLGFDAGDSNLYRYVNNQPTISTDPSGLQPGNTPTLKDVRNLKKLVIADFQKILDGYTSATKAGASPISDESKAGLLLFLARMTNLGVAKLGKQFPSEVKKAGALIDQLPQILVPASAEREYIPYLAVSDAAPAGILDSIVRIALDVSTVAHTAVTIQSLGAADFKTRTNAEKALKDLAVTDYSVVVPVLLATKTGDAETKNRISGIVANANSRLSQALHGSELRPLLMKLQLNRLWALYTDSEKALIIGEIGDAKGVYPELVRSALNKKE
jgi:RHS repeat-associated protein